MAIKNSWYLW